MLSQLFLVFCFGLPFILSQTIDIQKTTNQKLHHTSQYTFNSGLVVRRGEKITFALSGESATTAELALTDGGKPAFTISGGDNSTLGASQSEGSIQVQGNSVIVFLNPNCPIGKYNMEFTIGSTKVSVKESLYILFNPWNSQDETYMQNTNDLNEYVLNENGLLYRSNKDNTYPGSSWNYDQFEEVVLDTTMSYVHSLALEQRKTSVLVSRLLTYRTNSDGQNSGLMLGRWKEDFPGGTAPWVWTGTKSIVSEYAKNQQAVKYAQCWVYAGVLTSLLRTIGIASRPVTNFVSGHDTGKDGNIDYYIDRDGNRIGSKTTDSVWNFHVWSEGYMRRTNQDESGWQALDATPQEKSEGKFQMGPASVKSVSNMLKQSSYDAIFVIGEVLADEVTHQEQADGSFKPIQTKKRATGKRLVTKQVGSNNHNFLNDAYQQGAGNNNTNTTNPDDLKFKLQSEESILGKEISIKITASGKDVEKHKAKYHVVFNAVAYNGKILQKLNVEDIQVDFSKTKEQTVKLAASKYEKHFVNTGNAVECVLVATVEGTEQVARETKRVELKLPQKIIIDWKVDKKVFLINREYSALVTFKNPFESRVLTEGVLRVSTATKYFDAQSIDIGEIEGGATVVKKVTIKGKKAGKATINFEIDFKELKNNEVDEGVTFTSNAQESQSQDFSGAMSHRETMGTSMFMMLLAALYMYM